MALENDLERYFDRLWPIMRSITGDGVRKSLDIIEELVPLTRHEIESGRNVFDWQIPQEWSYIGASIEGPDGKKILDVDNNNLHLVNYSEPFVGVLSKGELDKHLHSLPNQPDAIPYVTSYYKRQWGFCMTHRQRESLPEGNYKVSIDTNLFDGSLTIGEAFFPGRLEDEILFSTYICHPSMANNELSGPLVTAFLANYVSSMTDRKFSYRFLFLPETIGSIAYLSMYGDKLKEKLRAGFVITCVGDEAPFTFKKSRGGQSLAEQVGLFALEKSGHDFSVRDFFPNRGSDERQYCSPGFNLPVASVIRSVYAEYPEYHTSLDNKDFISFPAMSKSVDLCKQIISVLELNSKFLSLNQHCEPNLSRHGLYPTVSKKGQADFVSALLWLINYSDGTHDLIDIAKLSGYDLQLLASLAKDCVSKGLFEELK